MIRYIAITAAMALILDVAIMIFYPFFCDLYTATRIANTILTVSMASVATIAFNKL